MNLIRTLTALAAALIVCAHATAADLELGPHTLELDNDTTVEAEAGWLHLPETRGGESDRTVSIRFVRLATDHADPAPPVFVLAGGPGSSYVDRLERAWFYEQLERFQAYADVVVFDHRGSGQSLPNLTCDGRTPVNISGGLTEEALIGVMREAMIRCRNHWIAEGVDLSAYNVDSIARDTDDLRAALGYDTVSLYGGSFGSHLGLHYIRLFPERVHRAVFAGIEGPDDTYDAPSEYLATLERIARHAEASEELGDSLPDVGLIEALKQTVERLRDEPQTVMLGDREVIVTEAVIRAFGDFRAGDRGQPTFWPMLITSWYEGDLTMAARAGGSLRSLPPIDAMKFVVDANSGGSPERMARLETDEGAGLFLREAMEREAGAGVWPTANLGPGFWEPVTADTTVLLVHGQWDTSTPIENARRAAAALPNGHLIEVVHGRHGAMNDLYNHWPAVHEKLESFLRGEPTEFPDRFTIPPVDYGEGG